MQEPQRLLMRLNPIALDWQSQRVTGEVLKAEDIAACLAGLARGPYLLLLYLWCLDETVRGELYHLIVEEVLGLPSKHNWQSKPNQGKLYLLIKLALKELQQDKLCNKCNGTGIIAIQPCLACNGIGRRRYTQAEYARQCGVKPSNWQRLWAFKYQEIYLLLSDWNEMGVRHLLDRLS